MAVIHEEVIPARGVTVLELERGNVLKVTDIEGQQVADVVAFNADELGERLNNDISMILNGRWLLTLGNVLYSEDCKPMFTIIGDDVGEHYPGGTMCSNESNLFRYGVDGTPNCRDLLTEALSPWGISKRQLPGAFAPFMNVPHRSDGSAQIDIPNSKPGDALVLRTEMRLVVGISACPQERNPCNGFNPTPLGITVFSHESDLDED